MPATGIEPVLYRYNRILSPARLPVPPRGRIHYIQGLCGSLLSTYRGPLFLRDVQPFECSLRSRAAQSTKASSLGSTAIICSLCSRAVPVVRFSHFVGPSLVQWAEKDSNLRRHCQQIYSLSPLATRESTHMKNMTSQAFHKADDRTRTDNLLITNQLLCQLSHIGIFN